MKSISFGNFFFKPVMTNDNPNSVNFDITTAKFAYIDYVGEPMFVDNNRYYALLKKRNHNAFCFFNINGFLMWMKENNLHFQLHDICLNKLKEN